MNLLKHAFLIFIIFPFLSFAKVSNSYEGCGSLSYQQIKKEEDNTAASFILNGEGRQVYNIDKDWFYLEDNPVHVSELSQSQKCWQKINLPHTWNRFDNLDSEPGYRRDAGWYEKSIFIPQLNDGKKIVIHFDGANITSKIYVNNKLAGGHVGGYVGFDVDITPFIKENENNIIDVRVDNSVDPNIIPSQKSDFFIYGGLVRHVWLKVFPQNYIQSFHALISGVSTASAQTKIEANIDCGSSANTILKAQLIDPQGKTILQKQNDEKLSAGKNLIVLNLPEIHSPELWSPDHPNLYKVKMSLEQGGRLIDSTTDLIGYRWYEFKDHGAFYLNGKKLLIKGTCRHEDYAGYGEAVPDSLQWKDIRMMKEMGANFVRLAHYPQSPVVYKACDQLGILVWDELPWCRGGEGGNLWKANTKRLLTEQINQNFNHPSIIIWSLGNELDWLPDFPNGSIPDSLDSFLRTLNNIAHKMDPSRLTAARKYEGAAKIVDVFSPSIWAGWYSGVYTNYQRAIEDAQAKYPHLLHVEYGGSSLLGRHTENPITGEGVLNPNEWDEKANKIKVSSIANMGDWSENYIVDLFDWHLRYTMQTTTFAGNVQWAFKDFPTPLRPENPIPYMNLKGLLDRNGNPKDAYYVFKSYWTTNPLFCYIESHTWTQRSGPENLKRTMDVYSNCDSVKLFLNGKNLGMKVKDIKKFPASGLTWDLLFKEGSNNLKAVGYGSSDEPAVDSMTVNYTYKHAGTPDGIKLSSGKLSNGDFLITASVVDKDGQRCLDYNKRVYFALSGSGNLMENYGTVTRSSIIECANGEAQIEFHPDGNKPAAVEVRNQSFQGDYIKLQDSDASGDTVSFWDGKQLNGFNFILRDKSASTENLYNVEEGAMDFSTKEVGYFYTTKNYPADFKLHAEWSWYDENEKGNSGILLFIQKPDTVWPECFQVNFKKDNAGDIIGMNGAAATETIGKPSTTTLKFKASNEKPAGQWNECDVISKNDSLVVYVNGLLQNKATHLNFTNGKIGFQLEGKPIKFRNIYLVKLQK